MGPIVVEPEVLAGAGVSISDVGDELAAALSTLAASLPNGAMAGHDRAGLVFGQAYRQAAQALMDAGAEAVSGGRQVGFGVQISATNYSHADASSTIGGGATPLAAPTAPGKFDAPSVPSPFGGGVAEPFLWSMVEMLVGDVWPNGDPAQLRAAGSAWSAFARALSGIGGQLEGPSATISGQQIPEGSAIAKDLSDLKQGLSDIATECVKLGVQIFEFAADVEAAQNAIRDLLSRLSPAGIFDGIQAIFSGDALEELKEIAEDIRTVLDNLGRQADARQQSMQGLMQMIDDAVVSLQDKARKEFTDVLGEDVGNAVATAFDIQTNVGEAPIKLGLQTVAGLQQLNPMRFAHDFEGAKETWSAVADTFKYADPMGIALDPLGAFDHYKGQLEGLAHVEDWSTDRPGLGPAMVASEIGSVLIPGGAATRGTRAVADAADAAEGAAPAVRAAGVLDNAAADTSAIAGRAGSISEKLDNLGNNIPKVEAPSGPAIPPSLTESPSAPRVPEAPGPRVPDAPTPHGPGSPTPHGPDSTPVDRSPTAPHSSTPTSAPAHADAGPGDAPRTGTPPIGAVPESRVPAAVEAPSAPHQPAPTTPASSVPTNAAPPVAGHLPEAAPSAAHAPSSTTPDAPAHPDPRGPEASSPHSQTEPSAGTTSDGPHHDQPSHPHGDTQDLGDQQPGHDPGTAHSNDDELRDMRPWDRERVDLAINPGELQQHLLDGGCPPEIAASAADGPHAGMTPDELLAKHWDSEHHRWNWPLENGFKDGEWTVGDRIPSDARLDRIGAVSERTGDFMAAEGDSYPSRALAPGSSGDYNVFEGTDKPLPPGWEARYGEVGEAFDQPGGGTQWVVVDEFGDTVLIDTLVEGGYLRPVSGPFFDAWKTSRGGS